MINDMFNKHNYKITDCFFGIFFSPIDLFQ